jgi:acyl carrier protein
MIASTETLTALKQIVTDITKVAEVRDDANLFEDCGLDSMSVLDLVLAIEEKFGISISADELQTELFQRVSNLAEFVDSKLSTGR